MSFEIQNRDRSLKAIRRRFQYNTGGIGTGIKVGELPVGALILSSRVQIITPFNASGGDLLAAGQVSGNIEFMVNGDLSGEANTVVDQTGRAVQQFDLLGATNPIPVFIQYTQSGDAATAGDALFVLEYLEPETLTAL